MLGIDPGELERDNCSPMLQIDKIRIAVVCYWLVGIRKFFIRKFFRKFFDFFLNEVFQQRFRGKKGFISVWEDRVVY
jgi:hypothetical protein